MYADSTAVVGPLASVVEPHSYDLCDTHAVRLTAPRGWNLIRIEAEVDEGRRTEDLEALANVVREAAPDPVGEPAPAYAPEPIPLADAIGEGIQRGHLRSLPGVLPGMDH